MHRLGASGAAALLVVVELVGCAARPLRSPSAASEEDRRIEAAQREIEAHDRQLRRQEAEIEELRARAEQEKLRTRSAVEKRVDQLDEDDDDDPY